MAALQERGDFDIGLMEPLGLEGDGDVEFLPLLPRMWMGNTAGSPAWILGFLFSRASPDE